MTVEVHPLKPWARQCCGSGRTFRAWLPNRGTSCRIDRLLCSVCNRPSTLAGVKDLERERPVFWPKLPLSWQTTRSTSWRSGCFGLCSPAPSSLTCSSGFKDMPEPRALLLLPPLPLARTPGPAWIASQRFWHAGGPAVCKHLPMIKLTSVCHCCACINCGMLFSVPCAWWSACLAPFFLYWETPRSFAVRGGGPFWLSDCHSGAWP